MRMALAKRARRHGNKETTLHCGIANNIVAT